MKRLLIIIVIMFTGIAAYACPACERQQPRILKNVSHGTGPQGNLDLFIIAATAALVVLTLFLSVKWLIKPEEVEPDHIKRTVLDF